MYWVSVQRSVRLQLWPRSRYVHWPLALYVWPYDLPVIMELPSHPTFVNYLQRHHPTVLLPVTFLWLPTHHQHLYLLLHLPPWPGIQITRINKLKMIKRLSLYRFQSFQHRLLMFHWHLKTFFLKLCTSWFFIHDLIYQLLHLFICS